MSINVNLNLNVPDALIEALQALAGSLSMDPPVEVAPDAKPEIPKVETKRRAKTKAEPGPEPKEPEAAEDTPVVTLETVRAKLAALARDGKQAEVKKLINKYGASKLTDIPADKYAELLADAEDL